METSVSIRNIRKGYGAVVAVDDVTLTIRRGEFFSLLGPSGCGKTSLLRIIGGFEDFDSGQLLLDGCDMHGVPPYARSTNMIFQNLALFPHLTVSQNVAFGLRMRGVDRRSQRERVERVLKLVNLEEFAQRKPSQISGGQKQRVAFARAVVTEPPVLLLDEPFGALDTRLREDIRAEFILLQERLGIATILVTHDQEEALSFGHRVAVLNGGKICQIASPEDIYEAPADPFVATFVGKGSLMAAVWGGRTGGKAELRLGSQVLRCDERGIRGNAAIAAGAPMQFFVRPDWLSLLPGSEADRSEAMVGRGTISRRRFAGDHFEYDVELESGQTVMVNVSPLEPNLKLGDAVGVELRPGRVPCIFEMRRVVMSGRQS